MVLGVAGGCDAVNVQSDSASDSSPASFDKADLLYEPVSLASGDLFSIELVDDQFGQAVARIVHEGTAGGEHQLRARFTPLQPSSVTVVCRNEATGAKQTMTTLNRDGLTAKSGTGAVATSDDDRDSFHYIDNGDNIIVEVDYKEDSDDSMEETSQDGEAGFRFKSTSQSVQCTHVSFALEGVSSSLSADKVRFGGDVEAPEIRKETYR